MSGSVYKIVRIYKTNDEIDYLRIVDSWNDDIVNEIE